LHVISQFVDPGVQDVTANCVLKGRLLPLSAHEIAEEVEDEVDVEVEDDEDEGVALAHAMSEMSVYMLG